MVKEACAMTQKFELAQYVSQGCEAWSNWKIQKLELQHFIVKEN